MADDFPIGTAILKLIDMDGVPYWMVTVDMDTWETDNPPVARATDLMEAMELFIYLCHFNTPELEA